MKRIYTALIFTLALGASVTSTAYAAKSFDQEQQTVRAVHAKQAAATKHAELQACAQAHAGMGEMQAPVAH